MGGGAVVPQRWELGLAGCLSFPTYSPPHTHVHTHALAHTHATHSPTHTHTRMCTHKFTPSTRPPPFPHTRSHMCTHALTCPHSLHPPPTCTHTFTPARIHTHSHTLTLLHTLARAHMHAHTYTLTHARPQSLYTYSPAHMHSHTHAPCSHVTHAVACVCTYTPPTHQPPHTCTYTRIPTFIHSQMPVGSRPHLHTDSRAHVCTLHAHTPWPADGRCSRSVQLERLKAERCWAPTPPSPHLHAAGLELCTGLPIASGTTWKDLSMLVILHISLVLSVNLQMIGIPPDWTEQQPDRGASVHAFKEVGWAKNSVSDGSGDWKG